MDYLFRIPGWLFSLLLFIVLTPLVLLMHGEVTYTYENRPEYYFWLNESKGLPLLITLGALLIYLWLMAILVRYCQQRSAAWLMVFPAVISLFFIASILPVALREIGLLESTESLRNITNALVRQLGEDRYLIGGFSALLITGVLATFTVIRMTSRHWRDWLLIPLAMLFIPLGVLWLQPRLRYLLERQSITEVEEHFLD